MLLELTLVVVPLPYLGLSPMNTFRVREHSLFKLREKWADPEEVLRLLLLVVVDLLAILCDSR